MELLLSVSRDEKKDEIAKRISTSLHIFLRTMSVIIVITNVLLI